MISTLSGEWLNYLSTPKNPKNKDLKPAQTTDSSKFK